ncbi:methyl-accepting chemotaxis protein [Vibrio plantisponsor]|uniref:Methyl-accepting chemotaxis protein n=1 Tax=Vibrio plantisponsor TaxID=664643 RepID=A0ABU4ILI1_9VIBR|nr:methyl-accepting chemotaxis protein [Vibrio plantisponsor]MDW6019417.1 methyl-accepting chemotaxis protein [Vibrio plantisponsor]NNM39255.1 methyl-accepting chemotaxis protein [Vibrio plantisponsor]
MSLTLKTKVLVSTLIAIAITAIALVIVSYQSSKEESWKNIYSESHNTLKAYSSGIGVWFHDKQLAVEGMKKEIEANPDLDLVPHLRQLMTSGSFGLSYYGNEQGEMFRQDPSLNKAGYDPRVRDWYKLAMQEKKPVTTDPYVSVTMKALVVTLASPVTVNGNIIGVVGSNLALDKLAKDVLSISVPGNGYAFLVNSKGNIVAHNNADLVLKPIADIHPDLTWQQLKNSSDNRSQFEIQLDDRAKIIASKSIENTDWMLVVVLDKKTLEEPIFATLLNQLLIAAGILIVLGIVASTVVSKQLQGLSHITKALTDIAEGNGDLTQRLEVRSNDEVGILAEKFNQFVGSLHTIMVNVRDITLSINRNADLSAKSASTRSSRVSMQQDEITMVATAVTEMAAATAEIANNAESTAKNANESVTLGQAGYEQMQKSIDSINQLASELNNSTKIIGELENHTQEISTILSTIRSIAEQTNLLALNAAIEAARAGEHGRGFAVVADEVRVLSQRTHQSTEEIQSKIEGLQKVTGEAVSAMTHSHSLVTTSVDDVQHMGDQLQQISQAISMISDMATQIASAAEEQSLVTSEINTNTESVRELSNGLAQDAAEGENEAHTLRDLVVQLEKQIGRFKI